MEYFVVRRTTVSVAAASVLQRFLRLLDVPALKWCHRLLSNRQTQTYLIELEFS